MTSNNDLFIGLVQASNVYEALAQISQEYPDRIDLTKIASYKLTKDHHKLIRWLDRSYDLPSFLSVVGASESDYRYAIRRSSAAASYTQNSRSGKAYQRYGNFLSADFALGTIRSEELEELEIILSKRTKNNALLVGPPGVGKTHLIYALAGEIADPIFQLNIANVLTSTKYRGELEAKLSELIEASIQDQFVIFVDEIHTLATMGSAEGGQNVLDLLKPWLTHPEFRMIGATTDAELAWITQDMAFKRRFSVLMLPPPSDEQCLVIYKNFIESGGLSLTESDIQEICAHVSHHLPEFNDPDRVLDFLEHFEAARAVETRNGKRAKPLVEMLDSYVKFKATTSVV